MSNLSFLGRTALAVGSAALALQNPARADMVALLGEATAGPSLRRLKNRIENDETGRQMLHDLEPRRFPPVPPAHETPPLSSTNSTPMSAAAVVEQVLQPEGKAIVEWMEREFPDGSLGREYARFMSVRGFDPADRAQVHIELVPDPKMAWTLQRYRDVHDLWHVLNDMPTTILGELGQKWFEATHTGLPVAILSAGAGPLRLKSKQRQVLFRDIVPWALKAGRQATDLMAIRYEDHLHRNLDELRDEWNILMPHEYLQEPEVLYRKRKTRKTNGDG